MMAAGVKNPVIRSEVSTHRISHGVAAKSQALSNCLACHGPDSRLKGSVLLASWAPGGVAPAWKVKLFLCRYCLNALDQENIPSRCALNGLEVDDIPSTLQSLNMFETMLLQKSKSFQTVVRLGPVKHRLPHSEMLKALKGRVVYLPLPLQPHNEMLPKGLPQDHQLHILVNGTPTKNKIVWQDIVRIDKLKAAMETLIAINPLYKDLDCSTNDIENYVYGSDGTNELQINPGPEALLEKVTPSQAKDIC